MINTPGAAIQGKKALIVISNGKSTRANSYIERLEQELKLANVEYVIFDKISANKDTLGVNFLNDPCALSNEDCVAIYEASYK